MFQSLQDIQSQETNSGKQMVSKRIMGRGPSQPTVPTETALASTHGTQDHPGYFQNRYVYNHAWISTNPIFYVTGDGREVPNIEKLRKHLLREGHLEKAELTELIREAIKIFRKYTHFRILTKVVFI